MNFPITSNIQHADSDRTVTKVIDKGYFVRCHWCKEPFIVDNMTAKTVGEGIFEHPVLVCPVCHKMCSVLYYYDQAHPATKRERNMISKRKYRRRQKYID